MFDGEGGKRPSRDVLVVPFIFVPHGDPVPTEWLAKRSDPIRLPARFVPRRASSDERQRRSPPSLVPSSADAPTFAEADDHVELGAGFDAPDRNRQDRVPVQLPSARDQDPVAAYMRVNAYFDSVGLGHQARVSTSGAANTARETFDRKLLVAEAPPNRAVAQSRRRLAAPTQDPTAPVPLVDDQGRPYSTRMRGPYSGQRASIRSSS